MHFKALILLPIVLTVLSACQTSSSHLSPAVSPQPLRNADTSIYCPTESEEARLAYNRGMDRVNQGDPEEAIQALRQAIALDPMFCDAMVRLGHLLRRQDHLDEAASWYKRSIEIFPGDPVAHKSLALVYRRQGNYAAAVAEHQCVIRMDADDPEGHFGLGMDYLESEDFRQALKPLRKAEQLYDQNASPRIVDARHALGVASYQLKDFKKSKYYFELIYDRFENDPGINYALGLCYVFEGKDLNEARRYLEKARQLGVEIPAEVEQKVDL